MKTLAGSIHLQEMPFASSASLSAGAKKRDAGCTVSLLDAWHTAQEASVFCEVFCKVQSLKKDNSALGHLKEGAL